MTLNLQLNLGGGEMGWCRKPHHSNCLILNNYNHVIENADNGNDCNIRINNNSNNYSGNKKQIRTAKMEKTAANNEVISHKIIKVYDWNGTCVFIAFVIASLLLLNVDVIIAAEQQCEPKILDEIPPDPVSFGFRFYSQQ